MSAAIDFYFDFTSPYGYLGSCRIEAVAERHQRTINWRPVLLGAIFRITGEKPLTETPLKGDYALHDFSRSAREYDVPYNHPSTFPIATVPAARAVYWLSDHEDPAISTRTADLVHALYAGLFVHDRNLGDADTVVAIAGELGLPTDALSPALGSDSVKQRLRSAVEQAVEQKVFGSPMMLVDGEPFWGNDRIEQLDRWLNQGGW